MTNAEIQAIAGGYHGDPFRVLGPHVVGAKDKPPAWVVRAFLPQASAAAVELEGVVQPMRKLHADGLFVAAFEGQPRGYRLKLTLHDGSEAELEDPYRFPPLLSEFDLHLHSEGTLYQSYDTLGAHLLELEGVAGVRFAVWAPNAEVVSVVGDFNDWDTRRHPLRLRTGGVWEIFLPGLGEGVHYKYFIRSRQQGHRELKADPHAFHCEVPPQSASIVARLDAHEWGDQAWMESRAKRNLLDEPVSIYEVHLESWLRGPRGETLTYLEIAPKLVAYVTRLGYTHVEFLPLTEHPYSGSWGYQTVGYFAPASRFGPPQDLMYLIDQCHRAGVGVILDWVPAHFPKDAHGLAFFDGTALYEHADPRRGEHKEWGTLIFNYGRNEVRGFLVSSALFWLNRYHIDGLRVDAVASMLYLDYSRKPGEWVPNQYGGNENLEAIDFLRKFNELTHQVPGVVTIAEESTAFPGVSRPVYLGGLGFTMKWNMGWMHDMLDYFSTQPVHRKFRHKNITFSLLYAFTENFVLPISHDEVVHGKRSLLSKMPGDEWQRFANARAFLAYMYAHPGKKLLFMGVDIGQYEEWDYEGSVRWELLEFDYHRKLQELVRALNTLYRSHPAIYQVDFNHTGFEWVDFHDVDSSIIAFLRRAKDPEDFLLFCCNFTPVPRMNYRFGVPAEGFYEEVLNTDSEAFGGTNLGNYGGAASLTRPCHGRDHSISVTLPPLAVVAFRRRRGD
jgi:1,4-alpha-glucan branching enzyme